MRHGVCCEEVDRSGNGPGGAPSLGPAVAQETEHHHHEEQLGTVTFPTSCPAAVQKDFERGVALLHSFWYEEAEKQFVAVTKASPGCAMAHWGVAMSLYHQLWEQVGKADLDRGLGGDSAEDRASPKTTEPPRGIPRGRRRLFRQYRRTRSRDAREGLTPTRHGEGLSRQPGRHRGGRVLRAVAARQHEPPNDTTFANRKKAIPILNELFAKNPDQPGVAHYLIHSCDKPQLAGDGSRGRAPLREDRALLPARAPHAVAHLHPPGSVAGIRSTQPRVHRVHEEEHRDAHGRRRPPVPRDGLPSVTPTCRRETT